jgi:hypothetical protein
MEVDDRALPLSRGQLDIWLAQETGLSGTEWQLGLFVRIEGTVERDALEWAIRQAVQEAEPARAAFFEVDGQVFQRAHKKQRRLEDLRRSHKNDAELGFITVVVLTHVKAHAEAYVAKPVDID